jgi:hypothetical protein
MQPGLLQVGRQAQLTEPSAAWLQFMLLVSIEIMMAALSSTA